MAVLWVGMVAAVVMATVIVVAVAMAVLCA